MVERRKFPGIGREISLLGFGLMRLPRVGDDPHGSEVDKKATAEMIDRALDGGVNYFDTAYMYIEGNAERAAGELLAGRHPRERFNLATKMPLMMLGDKNKEDVREIFEEQLRRCRVEHFDFYLAHNMVAGRLDDFRRCEVYEFMSRMKEQGKIRRMGFSFHDSPEVLRRIVKEWKFDFAQIQLNYLDWDLQFAGEQYKILTEAGLPVVVMEPVRGGALADLGERANAVFREADPQASAASWALRFAASLPGVMTVLSGMSDSGQLEDNLRTFSPLRPVDEVDRAVIGRAVEAYRSAGQIPCTGCRYCMDCPSGVDIPRMFEVYNHYKMTGNGMHFNNTYGLQGEGAQAHNCVSCGACVPQCPQGLDIPALLAQVDGEVRAMRERRRKG